MQKTKKSIDIKFKPIKIEVVKAIHRIKNKIRKEVKE